MKFISNIQSSIKPNYFRFLILLLLVFNVNTFSQNLDIKILKKINLNRNENFDGTFKFITNSTEPICLATPIIIYSIGLLNDDTHLKEKGIFIGETILVTTLFTTALKMSIKRKRPYENYPEIENLSTVGSYSFPSGHTSLTFATATALSISFPKWYVIVPSYFFASAVGYSRLHLGVHYPSDVLFGAILGSSSAYLTIHLNKWINSNKKKAIKNEN